MYGVSDIEKNSKHPINNKTTEIASPSTPSIKLIAFIIATIINIVSKCATILFNSKIPNTPCKLSIISPYL